MPEQTKIQRLLASAAFQGLSEESKRELIDEAMASDSPTWATLSDESKNELRQELLGAPPTLAAGTPPPASPLPATQPPSGAAGAPSLPQPQQPQRSYENADFPLEMAKGFVRGTARLPGDMLSSVASVMEGVGGKNPVQQKLDEWGGGLTRLGERIAPREMPTFNEAEGFWPSAAAAMTNVAETLPNLVLPSAAAAKVASLAGNAMKAGGIILRLAKAGKVLDAEGKVVPLAKALASMAGAWAMSAPQEVGSIRQGRIAEGLETDPSKEIGYGAAAGALDAVTPGYWAAKLVKSGGQITTEMLRTAARGIKAGMGAGRVAKATLGTLASEVPQEIGQTGLERLGQDKDLTSPEAIAEYKETAATMGPLAMFLGPLAGAASIHQDVNTIKEGAKQRKVSVQELMGDTGLLTPEQVEQINNAVNLMNGVGNASQQQGAVPTDAGGGPRVEVGAEGAIPPGGEGVRPGPVPGEAAGAQAPQEGTQPQGTVRPPRLTEAKLVELVDQAGYERDEKRLEEVVKAAEQMGFVGANSTNKLKAAIDRARKYIKETTHPIDSMPSAPQPTQRTFQDFAAAPDEYRDVSRNVQRAIKNGEISSVEQIDELKNTLSKMGHADSHIITVLDKLRESMAGKATKGITIDEREQQHAEGMQYNADLKRFREAKTQQEKFGIAREVTARRRGAAAQTLSSDDVISMYDQMAEEVNRVRPVEPKKSKNERMKQLDETMKAFSAAADEYRSRKRAESDASQAAAAAVLRDERQQEVAAGFGLKPSATAMPSEVPDTQQHAKAQRVAKVMKEFNKTLSPEERLEIVRNGLAVHMEVEPSAVPDDIVKKTFVVLQDAEQQAAFARAPKGLPVLKGQKGATGAAKQSAEEAAEADPIPMLGAPRRKLPPAPTPEQIVQEAAAPLAAEPAQLKSTTMAHIANMVQNANTNEEITRALSVATADQRRRKSLRKIVANRIAQIQAGVKATPAAPLAVPAAPKERPKVATTVIADQIAGARNKGAIESAIAVATKEQMQSPTVRSAIRRAEKRLGVRHNIVGRKLFEQAQTLRSWVKDRGGIVPSAIVGNLTVKGKGRNAKAVGQEEVFGREGMGIHKSFLKPGWATGATKYKGNLSDGGVTVEDALTSGLLPEGATTSDVVDALRAPWGSLPEDSLKSEEQLAYERDEREQRQMDKFYEQEMAQEEQAKQEGAAEREAIQKEDEELPPPESPFSVKRVAGARQTGGIVFTKQMIQGAMPKAKVVERPYGFDAAYENGLKFKFVNVNQIAADPRSLAAHGITMEQFRKGESFIEGSFGIVGQNAIIKLSKGGVQDFLLDHETFHAAMAMALPDKMRKAVLNKYRQPGDTDAQAEERAAYAYQRWSPGDGGIFHRIYRFFKNLADQMGLATLSESEQAEQAFVQTRSGRAFEKAPGGMGQRGEALSVKESPEDIYGYEEQKAAMQREETQEEFARRVERERVLVDPDVTGLELPTLEQEIPAAYGGERIWPDVGSNWLMPNGKFVALPMQHGLTRTPHLEANPVQPPLIDKVVQNAARIMKMGVVRINVQGPRPGQYREGPHRGATRVHVELGYGPTPTAAQIQALDELADLYTVIVERSVLPSKPGETMDYRSVTVRPGSMSTGAAVGQVMRAEKQQYFSPYAEYYSVKRGPVPEGMVRVKISRALDDEYESRGVYPEAKLGISDIPVEVAKDMLDDAHYYGVSSGRPDDVSAGITAIYRALWNQMSKVMPEEAKRIVEKDRRSARGFDWRNPEAFSVRNAAPASEAGVRSPKEIERARSLWEEMGTESPYFKRWFGDSVIKDDDGEPRVMYHGTSKDSPFSTFRIGMRGAFFTPSSEIASEYSTSNDSQRLEYDRGRFVRKNTSPRVYPVYLRVSNPSKPTPEELTKMFNSPNYEQIQREIFPKYKARGHDGLWMPDGSMVVFSPEQIKSATGNRGTFDETNADIRYSVKKSFVPPKQTVTAYKLFRTNPRMPGKLFPLFIGRNEPVPEGEWVVAEYKPTKGYAERPGWHAGVLPTAPHLRSQDGFMAQDRVWAEVELPADTDWQPEADSSKTRDIRGKVPSGGYYRFKTNKMQGGAWMIGGALRVKRVLTDADVREILTSAGETDAASKEQHNAPGGREAYSVRRSRDRFLPGMGQDQGVLPGIEPQTEPLAPDAVPTNTERPRDIGQQGNLFQWDRQQRRAQQPPEPEPPKNATPEQLELFSAAPEIAKPNSEIEKLKEGPKFSVRGGGAASEQQNREWDIYRSLFGDRGVPVVRWFIRDLMQGAVFGPDSTAGEYIIRRLGAKLGEQFRNKTEKTKSNALRYGSRWKNAMFAEWRKLPKERRKWIYDNFLWAYEDGKVPEDIKPFAAAWEMVNKDIKEHAEDLGVETSYLDSDGNQRRLPFVGIDPKRFAPHRLTEKAYDAFRNKRGPLWEAIQEAAKVRGVELDEMMDIRNLALSTKRHHGLEHVRMADLPRSVMVNGEKVDVLRGDFGVIDNHIASAARRLAVIENFGPGASTDYLNAVIDDLTSAGMDKGKAGELVKETWTRLQGAESGTEFFEGHPKVRSIWKAVDAATAAANLSAAAIPNWIGGFLPEMIRMGFVPAAKEFVYSLTHTIKGGTNVEVGEGAKRKTLDLNDYFNLAEDLMDAMTKSTSLAGLMPAEKLEGRSKRAAEKLLRATSFHAANRFINHGVVYGVVKNNLTSLLERVYKDDRSALKRLWGLDKRTAMRYLTEEWGFTNDDVERMMLWGPSNEDMARAVQRQVELVNSMHESPMTRPAYMNRPLWRVMMAYSTYARKMGRTTWYALSEANKGNVRPLTYLMFAGAATGELVNAVRNAFKDREREEKGFGERLLKDYFEAATFGLIGQVEYAARNLGEPTHSFFEDMFMPPQLETLHRFGQGIQNAFKAAGTGLEPPWRPFLKGVARVAPIVDIGYKQATKALELDDEFVDRIRPMVYLGGKGTGRRPLEAKEGRENTVKMLLDRWQEQGKSKAALLAKLRNLSQQESMTRRQKRVQEIREKRLAERGLQ